MSKYLDLRSINPHRDSMPKADMSTLQASSRSQVDMQSSHFKGSYSSRQFNHNLILKQHRELNDYYGRSGEHFSSVQSDIQRKLKSISKEMNHQEAEVSAQQSLNATGLLNVKKVSDSKTTVKQKGAEHCNERLDTQMELFELKERYNEKCRELNAVKDKLLSKDKWYESKVIRLRQQESDIKQLTAALEQRAKALTVDRTLLNEQQRHFEEQRKDLLERQKQLQMLEESVNEREQNLQESITRVQKNETQLTSDFSTVKLYEKHLEERQQLMDQYSKTIQERETELFAREASLEQKEQSLSLQLSSLKEHETQHLIKRSVLTIIEEKLAAKIQTLANIQEKLFHKMLQLDAPDENTYIKPSEREEFQKQLDTSIASQEEVLGRNGSLYRRCQQPKVSVLCQQVATAQKVIAVQFSDIKPCHRYNTLQMNLIKHMNQSIMKKKLNLNAAPFQLTPQTPSPRQFQAQEHFQVQTHHQLKPQLQGHSQLEILPTQEDLNVLLGRRNIGGLPNLKNTFRVMSYNILADSLVNTEELTSPQHSRWDFRLPLILKEIKYYDPSVLCLQEVDSNEKLLPQELAQLGYEVIYMVYTKGLFFKRTDPQKQDGCAIYFKKSIYDLHEKYLLNLAATDVDPFFLSRPNVAIFVLLKERVSGKLILVANTHILFNTHRGDIKLLQIQMIMSAIKSIVSKRENIPFILAGDFNLIPNSPIYQYLSQGTISTNINLKDASRQDYAMLDTSNVVDTLRRLRHNTRIHRGERFMHHSSMKGFKQWLQLFATLRVTVDDKSNLTVKTSDQQNSKQVENNLSAQLLSAYSHCYSLAYKLDRRNLREQFNDHSTFEPHLTTYSKSTKGTVDYIWFIDLYHKFRFSNSYNRSDQLQISSVMEVPKSEDLLGLSYFPNQIYPSDHISLIADFGYYPSGE